MRKIDHDSAKMQETTISNDEREWQAVQFNDLNLSRLPTFEFRLCSAETVHMGARKRDLTNLSGFQWSVEDRHGYFYVYDAETQPIVSSYGLPPPIARSLHERRKVGWRHAECHDLRRGHKERQRPYIRRRNQRRLR